MARSLLRWILPLPFLVYPQLETREGRFDSLDGSRLSYSVSASRVD